MDDWRTWPRERLEREYTPSSRVSGGYAPFVERWAEGTRLAWESAGARLGLRYGPGADELLDLFVPADAVRPVPLVVFLHGGYWQEGSRADAGFAAPGLGRAGVALAVPEYTLAPAASVAAITDQACRAVAWVAAEGRALGLDPARLVVAGHSAGAHLATMAALRLPAGTMAALVLIGGVFDLEPLVGTSVNDALGLDAAEARRLSPLRHVRPGLPPALVAWGDGETDEFRRQSRELAEAWAAAGNDAAAVEVAGRHHFDLPLDLGDPSTELGARTIGLVRDGRL